MTSRHRVSTLGKVAAEAGSFALVVAVFLAISLPRLFRPDPEGPIPPEVLSMPEPPPAVDPATLPEARDRMPPLPALPTAAAPLPEWPAEPISAPPLTDLTSLAFSTDFGLLLADPAVVEVFSLDELDRPPGLRAGVPPNYPRELRRERIGGVVRLRVAVRPDGRVEVREVVDSPHPALPNAALDAAVRYRYEPPSRNGNPVEAEFIMPFVFDP